MVRTVPLGALASLALAVAAGCGTEPTTPSAPVDVFYRPTGIAAVKPAGGSATALLVASSNADLLYDLDTGGSVIWVDPAQDPAAWRSGMDVPSFAGDLAVAADGCGAGTGTLAAFASRATRTLSVLNVDENTGLSCNACNVALEGSFTDPYPVAFACRPDRNSVFVGYLRSVGAAGWITEYRLDGLDKGTVVHGNVSPAQAAPVRSFAYDPYPQRLYFTGPALSVPTPLRWMDLVGDCRIDVAPDAPKGCPRGNVTMTGFQKNIEFEGIALAPSGPGVPARAYITARVYDLDAAATAGGRTTDYEGLLLVADIVDGPLGAPELVLRKRVEGIGFGAGEVRVVSTTATPQRDIVAALASDSGRLTIYDDETGEDPQVIESDKNGSPLLGHVPFGLAVDPIAPDVNKVRLYVGSFNDSFVTPVDVTLGPQVSAAPDITRRISGGTR